jgi:hypothetical protein
VWIGDWGLGIGDGELWSVSDSGALLQAGETHEHLNTRTPFKGELWNWEFGNLSDVAALQARKTPEHLNTFHE